MNALEARLFPPAYRSVRRMANGYVMPVWTVRHMIEVPRVQGGVVEVTLHEWTFANGIAAVLFADRRTDRPVAGWYEVRDSNDRWRGSYRSEETTNGM